MKFLKNLLPAAALLALASASVQAATAPTATNVIHIAGSTAFRSAVHNAIARLMGSTGTAAYIGTNLAGANLAVFSGTIGGSSVVVETAWLGSLSGQGYLINNNNDTFLTAANIPTSGANAAKAPTSAGTQTPFFTNYGLSKGAGGGYQIASSGSAGTTESVPADFALSDAFQTSGAFLSSPLLAGVSATGALEPASGNGTGAGEEVGIIPFVWVKSAANTSDGTAYSTTWKGITNISNLQGQQLLASNQVPASFLTGNSADINVTLYVTGRDGDSGTRLDALAETGFGIFNTTDQYTFGLTTAADGNSYDLAGETLNPNFDDYSYGLVLGVAPTPNVGGYSSGGTLAKAMAAKNGYSDLGGYIIGYLGVADADTVLSPNGKGDGSDTTDPVLPTGYVAGTQLTFNGVGESLAAINYGEYSFWTYEHFFARASNETITPYGESASSYYTANPLLLSTAGHIVSDLETTDANVAGYRTTQVTSVRSVEGGVVTPGTGAGM
jgi:hypothetical protein